MFQPGKDDAMKLTGRQQAFLNEFLRLYHEEHRPLHYTTVAQRLGLGKVTAYDMLRLLEEKGLVRSEYVLPDPDSRVGAGRSSVVFFPSERAMGSRPEWGHQEQRDWEKIRENILQILKDFKDNDYEVLVNQLLQRLEQPKSPLASAAEMVAAVILSLREIQKRVSINGLTSRLKAVGFPGELGLEALAGLTVGLSFVEDIHRCLAVQLLRHVQGYQANLSRLSVHSRRQLLDFAQEVWQITGT